MVIGILQFELLIRGAESLKDKRRVVSSLKDRLHREHQVSIAEVALQDKMSVARLGLAMVGTDGRYVAQTFDRITSKLRGLHDAELGSVSREVLTDPVGEDLPEGVDPLEQLASDTTLAEEMRRQAELLDNQDDAPGAPSRPGEPRP